MQNIFEWERIEERTIIPGYRAKFIHSANMTFALWDTDANAPLPGHSHEHEQVTHLLEGEFEITIGGVTNMMKPGSIAVIPSHMHHSGKAITPCRILDVFYPLRKDYMSHLTHTLLQNAHS